MKVIRISLVHGGIISYEAVHTSIRALLEEGEVCKTQAPIRREISAIYTDSNKSRYV